MSDTVRCDVCGKRANRRLRRVAPEGWSYGVAKMEEENDDLIVYACSLQCQQDFWKRGPGFMHLGTGELTESTVCTVCNETQYMSPGGITCKNGHGGAPGVAKAP